MDAEAVAIDKATGKLQPFQELSRRKRKDVKVEDIAVQVCLFVFDLLYLNGEVGRGLAGLATRSTNSFVPMPATAPPRARGPKKTSSGALSMGTIRIRFRQVIRWRDNGRNSSILRRVC